MQIHDKIWNNEEKISIASMFIREESKRIILCASGMLLAMLYLVLFAKLSAILLLIPFALFFLALLMVVFIGIRPFGQVFQKIGEFRQRKIQVDFQKPHEVHKLFMGELHLLSDCMICRSGGRLSLILVEEIIKVRNIQYSGSYGLTRNLIIWTDTARKYQIEFFGRHQKEIQEVIDWLQQKNSMITVEV